MLQGPGEARVHRPCDRDGEDDDDGYYDGENDDADIILMMIANIYDAAKHYLDLDLDRDLSSSSVDRNEALLKKHIIVIIVQNFHNHRLNYNCGSKFTSEGW